MDESRPDLRASDAERERVAAQLRDHCAEGRLTMSELDERLARAYAARTHGELLVLLRDLPELVHPLPVPHTALPAPVRRAGPSWPGWLTPPVANLLALSVLVVVVWVLTVVPDDFWPKWPIGVAAAVTAGGYLRERARQRHGPGDRSGHGHGHGCSGHGHGWSGHGGEGRRGRRP